MIADDPTLEEATALYQSVLVLTPEQRLERARHLLMSQGCEIRGVCTEVKNGGHKVRFETYICGFFDPAAFDLALENLRLKGVCCLDRRVELSHDGYHSMTITFWVTDEKARDPRERYDYLMQRGGVGIRF